MLVLRREFLNLAAATTAETAIRPFVTIQSKEQMSPKSSAVFAFQQLGFLLPTFPRQPFDCGHCRRRTKRTNAGIANWTNFSETTLLHQPKSPDADYRVRIFTRQPVTPTLRSCHV